MEPLRTQIGTPEAVISGTDKSISEFERLDSIKVSKNSKGYTWEIKRYYDFSRMTPEAVIAQIDDVNKKLQEKFG